ncbi:Putative aminoglycoside phosphotransferase [bacterium HR29]|jgi:aminoglycoside phosphotransferase (APT) family kinase protein|nr:Putative aminoglycoside phosphotransferase [bacterium HR29]
MRLASALEAFLHERLPAAEAVRVVAFRALPRGASNATWAVDLHIECAGAACDLACVLRLQREYGLLAPYDVLREHRVLRALDRAGVPVPRPLWAAARCEGIEAPFFLMLRVEGRSLPAFWYPAEGSELRAIAAQLAAIHALDWERAGLAFLVPEAAGRDPLACDLAGWRIRAAARGLEGHPLLVALGETLRRERPSDLRLGLLHGDPNPGNFILRGEEVAAVVDWELAALGDPRSDLGFYAALQTVFFAPPPVPGVTPLSRAYEDVTGVRLPDLAYFEALGLFKLAIVMAGVGGWGAFFSARETIERRLCELLGPRWAA